MSLIFLRTASAPNRSLTNCLILSRRTSRPVCDLPVVKSIILCQHDSLAGRSLASLDRTVDHGDVWSGGPCRARSGIARRERLADLLGSAHRRGHGHDEGQGFRGVGRKARTASESPLGNVREYVQRAI